MTISRSLEEKIEARIEEYLSDDSAKLEDIRRIVAQFRILPLSYDWSGAWAIRPDGEVIYFPYEPPYDLEIEKDPRIRNMAIFQGSKKYPELKELVPTRPPDAVDCSHCGGTGIEPMNEKLGFTEERIICYCGGLGWLPK